MEGTFKPNDLASYVPKKLFFCIIYCSVAYAFPSFAFADAYVPQQDPFIVGHNASLPENSALPCACGAR
jgi:hypothetical protein